MNENQVTSRKFWPRRVSWLTLLLAALTVISFFMISRPGMRYYDYPVSMGTSGGMGVVDYSGNTKAAPPNAVDASVMERGSVSVSAPSSGQMADPSFYYPYPYPNPEVPVTDTREFLKTYYGASMLTRDVQNLTRRVETTVRGYDGRIDNQSSSPQYGYVSFAVPQTKFDAFRAELEGLVGDKFITINISSQNLLPQKISIEEQQKQADSNLADYKSTRAKLVSAHTSTVATLQSKIDADTTQLAALRAQGQTPEVIAQIQTVSADLSSLQQQLSRENSSYTIRLSEADRNIKYAQDWVKAVQTQDKTLLENVATVNGTVSIQWISLWDCVRLYLPGYWIPFIFAVLTVISFLRDRQRFGVV